MKTLIFFLTVAIHAIAAATPSFNWDQRTYYPHADAPLASLTPAQIAQLNTYDSQYNPQFVYQSNPGGAGVSPADMAWVASVPAYFALSRDPVTGVLSGRGIYIYGQGDSGQPDLSQPATSADLTSTCQRLTDIYWRSNAAQAPQIVQVYSDLIEHYLDQNYLPGGRAAPWLSGGYVWRNHGWLPMRMAHVLTPQMRDLLGMSMFYVSCGWNLSSADPYVSTDDFYNILNTAFCGARLITNGPAKWQLLALARRGMDLSIYDLMPLDGSIIHHAGHHTHYAAYSFDNTMLHHLRFSYSGIVSPATTPEAIKRFRKAALAWSFATTGGINPAHQNMRSALPEYSAVGDGGWGRGVGWAYKAAQLQSYYYGTSVENDLEMAYAAIAKLQPGSGDLPVEWRSITPPAVPDRNSPLYTSSLLGHYSHTTNGTSIQRGPGHWYVSVRSQNDNYRGGEAYTPMAYADHFNELSMRSGMEVITTGKSGRKPNEVDSGIMFDGWNYFFYPNVTTGGDSDAQTSLLHSKTRAYFGGGGSPMGSANLRESALWMSNWNVKKSGFFIGNRIVMSTTGITGANQHTGLIQHGTKDAVMPSLVIDGSTKTETGDWILPSGGNHTFVDPQGNGYYVHPGADTSTLRARRGRQEWTYAFGQWLGSGAAPTYTWAWEFANQWHLWKPTWANYTRVWFDHGANANNQSLEFSLLVKPQPGELNTYATAMANPATAPVVITKNSNIHRYYDRATGTYAAAVFNPAETINEGSVISVNRTAAYIWRRDADLMNLSVSCSAFGGPYQVTLAGIWTFESSEDSGTVTVTTSGGNTVVSMGQISEAPLRVVLRSQSGTQWGTLASTVDVSTAHTSFAVNLNSAGIGTTPTYAITSGNPSGLFSVVGSQLKATRAFVPGDAGAQKIFVQVSQSSVVLGTIVVDVSVTDTALANAIADSDGDGFRNAYETSVGTNPNDPASKPTTSLAAFWDFNQGSGAPYDVVGGVPGSLVGGATVSASGHGGGAGNGALDLGTAGANMTVWNADFLNRVATGNKITISYWQKLDSATLPSGTAFFGVSSSNGRGLSGFSPWSDNVIYFDFGGTAAANRVSMAVGSTSLTQWNHFAFVKDGGTAQIWLNGVLLKSETGKAALLTDFNRFVVGALDAGVGFNGDIDEFAVFSSALDAAQIGSLASGTAPTAINAAANQAPVIATSSISVPENIAGNSVVGTVVGTDPEGGALTWYIIGDALADLFKINASTGAISTMPTASINYEGRTSYLLNVYARDALGANTIKVIQINVTNVNEAPVAKGFATTVFDNVPVGAAIGTATSTDPDAGQSRTWAITAGNTGGAFAVNANTGVVTTTQTLNAGVTQSYNLTLTVTDAGGLSSSEQVLLSIFGMQGITTDADGDGFSDSFEVSRGSNPNSAASVPTTALAAYWSFDQSGTPSTYSDMVRLLPATPLAGAVTSATGTGRSGGVTDRALDLSAAGSPRAELTSLGWLNQLAAADKITISVWQKFNASNGYGCAFWANSPSASGQRGLSAYTPWSDSVTYLDIGGTAAANRTSMGDGTPRAQWNNYVFVKNGGTTQIWINGTMWKSETGKVALKTDFNKLILGSDGSSPIRGKIDDFAVFNTALTSPTISALAAGTSPLFIDTILNNVAPTITTASLAFSEDIGGNAVIGTVLATDPDGPEPITWALSGGGGLFAINPTTGVVSTTELAEFDRETTASYTVTVTATDAYDKVGSRVITLDVNNVNEEPVAAGFNALVYDTFAIGAVVGTATVTDPDIGDTPTWAITAGNTGGAFAIHPTTGVVTVAQTLSATIPNFTLTVTATDSGGLTSDAIVKLSVFSMQNITVDSDGDGFSDAFENSRFTRINDAASKPTTHLGAYWNFDQAGTPAAYSDLVRALPATSIGGAVLSAPGTGRKGTANDRALDLSAAGSPRAELTSLGWLNQLAAADKITISLWQKFNASNGYGCAFWGTSLSASGLRGLSAYTPWSDNNTILDMGGTAAANRLWLGDGTPRAQWNNYVFVKNGGTVQVWINGIMWKSETGKVALKTDFNKLILGSDGTSPIRGLIDDFAIFNTALSSSEVGKLASGSSPLEISPVNQPAEITTTSFDLAENSPGQTTIGTLLASDPDGPSPVTWAIPGGSSLFVIDANTGVLKTAVAATFNYETTASYTLNVESRDGAGAIQVKPVTINITNVNEAPVFTANPISKPNGATGTAYSGTLAGSATDVDAGDTLSYSKISGPTWLNVAADGTLSGTPGVSHIGANAFSVRAIDAAGAFVTATLNITVTAALPAGWTTQDIGTVGLTGVAAESGGAYSVTAAGSGFDGTSDGFRFTWQTMSGDGEIKARLTSMSGGSGTFDAIMIRETTATGSKFATTGSNSAGGIWWQTRSSTGGSVSSGGNGTISLPCWVRLVRTGNTFVSYRSSDGVTWTQIASRTITMGSEVLAGMAVSSRNTGVLHTATFDNVTVVP